MKIYASLILVSALALTIQAEAPAEGNANGGLMGGLTNNLGALGGLMGGLGGIGSGILKQLGLGSADSELPEGKMGTLLYNTLKDLGVSNGAKDSALPGSGLLKDLPGAGALNNLPGADALKNLQGSGALKGLLDSGVFKNVPGADMLKSTLGQGDADASAQSKALLRVVAVFLNALEDDLEKLGELEKIKDTSSMEPKRAGAVNDAFEEIRQILPSLRASFDDFLDAAGQLETLAGLPEIISGDLVYAFSQTFGGLFSLVSNGVGWQMVTPSSLPALWNLVRATGSGAFGGASEQNSAAKMALRMALPPPLGLLL